MNECLLQLLYLLSGHSANKGFHMFEVSVFINISITCNIYKIGAVPAACIHIGAVNWQKVGVHMLFPNPRCILFFLSVCKIKRGAVIGTYRLLKWHVIIFRITVKFIFAQIAQRLFPSAFSSCFYEKQKKRRCGENTENN